MEDELRKKIIDLLYGKLDRPQQAKGLADSILSLLAPELEKQIPPNHGGDQPAQEDRGDCKGGNMRKEALEKLKEKARKWDRVKELAERNWLDEYPCEGCSVESMCDSSLSLCGQADSIVDALEGEVKE